MRVSQVKKLMLSGLSVETNNKNEMNPDTAKIMQLWNDYEEKNIYGATFNKTAKQDIYGVYSDYVSDVNGDYKVTVAVEVTKPKNAMIIENQRYLVFEKKVIYLILLLIVGKKFGHILKMNLNMKELII